MPFKPNEEPLNDHRIVTMKENGLRTSRSELLSIRNEGQKMNEIQCRSQ